MWQEQQLEQQRREAEGADEKQHEPPVKLLKLKPGPACYLRLDSKEVASRRARLRFDRSGLRASLKQRRLVASDDCPDCKGVPDTAKHVLLHCPAYAAARQTCEAAMRRANCTFDESTALGDVE